MRPALILSLLFALVLGACTASAAQPPIPQPRELAVPASCQLADANVRAYGASWSVTCDGQASTVVGNALTAAGWRACGAAAGTALYRKNDLITTISPLEAAQAKLVQFARGDECPQ